MPYAYICEPQLAQASFAKVLAWFIDGLSAKHK